MKWSKTKGLDLEGKDQASGTTSADTELLSMSRNSAASTNSLCSVCGGNLNVLVISLENGGHIITPPLPKEMATKAKVTEGRRRATRPDLVDAFYSPEGEI